MWTYNGEPVTKKNFPLPKDDNPEKGFVGIIYIMGAVIDGEKKFYIGKKTVYSPGKQKLGKTELAARPTKAHKDWKWITRYTNFENYYSENDVLKKAQVDGIEIQRAILYFCYSKRDLNYQETRHIFKADALEKDEFLNDNILGKFYKSQITKSI